MEKPIKYDIIAKFAKEKKVSRAAVETLIEELEKNHVLGIRKYNPVTRRQISVESENIRNAVRKLATENPGGTIQANILAQKLGVSPSSLNNNLRALSEEGIVKPAGFHKEPGRRGRGAVVWQFSN